MRTRNYNQLSDAQKRAAKRFADEYAMTTSQAAKYLDWCFAYLNGEIDATEFEKAAAHQLPESAKK